MKRELLFPMNLRMFGTEEDVEEVEDVVEEEVAEESEEEVEEAVPEEEVPEEPPAKKPATVPEATFLAEKKKRKELERKLREIDESKLDGQILARKDAKKQELIGKGFDETVAEEMANMLVEALAEVHSDRKRKSQDDIFLDELNDLASEEYYSDIKGFAPEIKAKMDKVKGLTIEEAYLLVRGPSRNREVKTAVEQKQALERRKASDKATPNSQPQGKEKQYKLTPAELKTVADLQKMQPEANWTKEKYYKLTKKG
jgi:hypothetical protein